MTAALLHVEDLHVAFDAKTVVDRQDFENRMLKAYIKDWPEEDSKNTEPNFP